MDVLDALEEIRDWNARNASGEEEGREGGREGGRCTPDHLMSLLSLSET